MLDTPRNGLRLHTPVQEPRNPSQTFPRRQAAAPAVSPALAFLNTKVNANGKSSPAQVVSVSSSDPLIPPSTDPETSSIKPSKVPLISPTQGPNGLSQFGSTTVVCLTKSFGLVGLITNGVPKGILTLLGEAGLSLRV